MKTEKRFDRKVLSASSCGFVATAVALCAIFAVHATDFYWTYNGEGNFNDATKWHRGSSTGETGTVPGPIDKVYIASTCTGCTIVVNGDYQLNAFGVSTAAYAGRHQGAFRDQPCNGQGRASVEDISVAKVECV